MTDKEHKQIEVPKVPTPIDKVAPVQKFAELFTKMEQVLNVPLVIYSYEVRQGNWKQYLVINAINPITGEEFRISSGSQRVMAQLLSLPAADFPISATFRKQGQAYFLGN